ncbi:glycosyltransferase [Clostridium sp. WLY-B-L2]|uniref:Glycosyltransferase n=1 Tax=Clostridium aromativorans TaxID=2836848 RepID=A0ABS8N958_9CLOT|nr:glycosyltransferase [Clostridium aromativorans]MCC9296344.1 glycosyltransferase [Clostridium aromativorans]
MKKIVMAEYLEYNSDFKVGNHHYAKMFANSGYKVLWLSPVYNHMTGIANERIFNQRKNLNKKFFEQIDRNIFGYSPYSLILYGKLPILNTKFANKLSIKLIIPNLKNSFKRNNFDNVDILWLTNPKYYYLTKIIKYNKLIYRCADDLSSFNWACKTMSYFEKRIIKKADLVFVTAHNLIKKKQCLRKDLIYLPNGVELGNFIRKKYIIPKKFQNNKRKKCIYVGAIDHWFDLNLLKYCAERLNQIDFYLIGPYKIDLISLKSCENIHILGKIDYKQIPNYLYYSDVGIIPFKVNNLTDSITPIKLYEYMSVGLNVVSTNFKEMKYIISPAYVAKSYDEFCKDIIKSIENKYKNKENNIKFAMKNTWQKRFEEIQSYL